jgi:hypothetical protein
MLYVCDHRGCGDTVFSKDETSPPQGWTMVLLNNAAALLCPDHRPVCPDQVRWSKVEAEGEGVMLGERNPDALLALLEKTGGERAEEYMKLLREIRACDMVDEERSALEQEWSRNAARFLARAGLR